jgi:basic membrane lipoprotein Med (substrate-binding protein (PBP1-ABC) superfamily)
LGLVSIIALIGAACGDDGGKTTTGGGGGKTSAAPGEKPVKMALVLPGNINDLSWNQMAYEGAKQLEKEGMVELSYTENVPEDAASVTQVVSGYAQQGNQLVIAHSFGYGDPLFKLAKDFPDTDFAWAGGIDKTDTNIADYAQPFWDASYLAGILAAGVTKTKVVGGLAGFDIPVCHAMLEAFKKGAQSVDDSITGINTYVGDWVDVAKSKEAAAAQADQKADVFMSCGEGPALGSIALAKDRNLAASGYVGDMSSLAPENVFASVVWDLHTLWGQMVADVQNDTFQPGKFYEVSVKDNGLHVAINPQFHEEIPADIMTKFNETLADIKSGAFTVPFDPGT